jgi:hypothetical protein
LKLAENKLDLLPCRDHRQPTGSFGPNGSLHVAHLLEEDLVVEKKDDVCYGKR